MRSSGPRLRTVVIDDDDDLRRMLGLTLELDGRFEVVGEAGDGRVGIDVIEHERPGGVIIDLDMPGMGGLEAVPQIRQRLPGSAIAVSSAAWLGTDSVPGADATVHKGESRASEALREALVASAARRPPIWPAWERRKAPRG